MQYIIQVKTLICRVRKEEMCFLDKSQFVFVLQAGGVGVVLILSVRSVLECTRGRWRMLRGKAGTRQRRTTTDFKVRESF